MAGELWSVMVRADAIVEQLRAVAPAAPPAGAAGAASAPTQGPAAGSIVAPMPPLPPLPPRRLPSMSVPVVLLSLGALCLLVAGVVFVAVTWSALGLTGRTLVLLAFTALLTGVALVVTRRGLRGAAETFWLVVAGMLTIDLLAAESAGLAGLDALSWRGTGALVGGALFAMGLGVAWWGRSQPVRQLHGASVVAVLGAMVVTATNGWLAENPAIGSSLALVVLTVLAVALARPLRVAAAGLGVLAVVTWLVVLSHGMARAGEAASFADWWSDVRGWPLLVAAAVPAAAAVFPRIPGVALPVWVRTALAAAAVLPLVLLVNAGAAPGDEAQQLLRAGTLIALAVVAAVSPRPWSHAAAVWAAVGAVGLGAQLMIMPWTSVTELPGTMSLEARMPPLAEDVAAWTWLPVAIAVMAALWGLSRVLPDLVPLDAEVVRRTLVVLAVAGLGLGAVTTVVGTEPSLWMGITAAGVATAAAGSATWVLRGGVAGVLGALATAHLALLTLAAAAPSDVASAVVATLLALALVVAFAALEDDDETVAAALVVVLAGLVGGYALVAWGELFDADEAARALAVAGYAALVGLVAAVATAHPSSRLAVEGTAVLVGLGAVGMSPDGETTAMVLTVLGSAVAAVSVIHGDRAVAGWFGTAVLLFATAIRVHLGVDAPELYTLPAAAVLVGAGLWRLQTDPRVSSTSALGSGLTLALMPSLLLALDEPVTLRGSLIAAGGIAVLALGVARRLAAPLVLGAFTTALLAVRHLEPYAEALPRWITLGAVGLALLGVGVTWEARLKNLHTAKRYLSGLR